MSLIARLIECGAPADVIEDVALLIAEKRALDQRMENEALRSARYRERGGGNIAPAVRRSVMERDGYCCQDCGAESDLCLDHIVPVSKGGNSEAVNLQVLCRPCNSRKKDRIRKRDARKMSENVRGQTRTSTASADTPDQKNPPQTPHKKLSPPISPKGDITPHANGGLTTDEVLQAWNDTANALGLPAVAKLTDQRRRKLAGRIRDHPFEDWEAALKAIRRSKWLQGENDRGWRANFDWLLQPNTIPKLIEGQFDDQKTTH